MAREAMEEAASIEGLEDIGIEGSKVEEKRFEEKAKVEEKMEVGDEK